MSANLVGSEPATVGSRLWAIGRCHRLPAGLTALYLVVGLIVGRLTGLPVSADLGVLGMANALAVGGTVVAIVVGAFVVVFLVTRAVFALGTTLGHAPEQPSTWRQYRRNLSLERLGGLFVVWTLLALLLTQFGAFKPAIPDFQPFVWDERFMRLDRLLHFGRDPWALIQPIVGYPIVTYALDSMYYLWFPISTLFFAWMGWRACDDVRSRFFLTYFSLWILLGTGMAIAFSSAGPVYYADVVGDPSPFGELTTYLDSVAERYPLVAPSVHEMLWAGYTGQSSVPVEGIAAMPSIHVAVPVLFSLAAWKIHHGLGIAFGLYAVVTLVGSVHLAWHYAIDGYVVVILVPALWWLSGLFVPAHTRQSP